MEIAVISGKGGTGKSSIAASLVTFCENILLADCDVDAANMYILFEPEIESEDVFLSGLKAEIHYEICTNCGLCMDYCRFGAISFKNEKYIISEVLCDGCVLCNRVCPHNAIEMIPNDKSRYYSGSFRNGKMVYGKLYPGEENSGRLVHLVRNKAKELAKANKIDTIIIDGPPGIGCPLISAIGGINHAIIVTEPTLSGLHDLKRTIETCNKFEIPISVIVNKYNLNNELTIELEKYCNSIDIKVIGKIPFDKEIINAMLNRKSILEHAPESEISMIIKETWKNFFEKEKQNSES